MKKEEILKEAKSMLFNTDMVQAFLEGRKGVTRRLVKPQPEKDMIHRLGYRPFRVLAGTEKHCLT